MKAYYYDNTLLDQRTPHDTDPTPLPPTHLTSLGITHHHLPASDTTAVDPIARERNYKNRDTIEISPTLLPNYEEKVKTFFHEHLHEDEEIRWILAGGGYFDVRDGEDRWVRMALEEGDLVVLPAGIYHRFTTDEKNVRCLPLNGIGLVRGFRVVFANLAPLWQYTKAMRLFKEDPKWTPLQRDEETDKNPYRQDYLKHREEAVDSVPDGQRMT